MSRRVSNDYGYCLELDQKIKRQDGYQQETDEFTDPIQCNNSSYSRQSTYKKTKIGAQT